MSGIGFLDLQGPYIDELGGRPWPQGGPFWVSKVHIFGAECAENFEKTAVFRGKFVIFEFYASIWPNFDQHDGFGLIWVQKIVFFDFETFSIFGLPMHNVCKLKCFQSTIIFHQFSFKIWSLIAFGLKTNYAKLCFYFHFIRKPLKDCKICPPALFDVEFRNSCMSSHINCYKTQECDIISGGQI